MTREILAPAVVVALGSIMTILDATIVNVLAPPAVLPRREA